MVYWIVLLVVVFLAGAVLWLVLTTLWPRGEQLPAAATPVRLSADQALASPLTGDQLEQIRFPLAVRGYSPVAVDNAIDQTLAYIRSLEQENEALRQRLNNEPTPRGI